MQYYTVEFRKWSNPRREDLTGYNAWDYLSGTPGEFGSKSEAARWLRSHHKGKDRYGVKALFKVVSHRGNAGRSSRQNPRAGVKLPRTGHTGFLRAKAVDVITRNGRVVEVKVKR